MKNIYSSFLKALIKYSNHRVLIPFYHAVSDTKVDFIGNLYPPRKIQDFENDLDVLLEYYEPISLIDLIKLVNSGNPLKKNYFHITFDDGLANFYEIVAPVLIRRGIPATIFLNTDFVDNKELFFRYKARLLYNYYLKSTINERNKFHQFVKNSVGNKKSISSFLFSINYSNKFVLDELASEINYSFNEYLLEHKPYLTKSQIKYLIENNFSIGSHSLNHPLYSELTLDEQIKQTTESLDFINNEFNLNYSTFSFPFTDLGVKKEFYKYLNEKKFVDITFGTSGIKKDSIYNNIHRLSFEFANKNADYFLIKEYLKFYIKILLKKNKIVRK